MQLFLPVCKCQELCAVSAQSLILSIKARLNIEHKSIVSKKRIPKNKTFVIVLIPYFGILTKPVVCWFFGTAFEIYEEVRNIVFSRFFWFDTVNKELNFSAHYSERFCFLQEACCNLEHTMWRLESLLDLLLSKHGKEILSDYSVLGGIYKVVECNLGMVTAIARSSRSYSIGIRNGDLEVFFFRIAFNINSRTSLGKVSSLFRYRGRSYIVQKQPTHQLLN